MVQISNIFTYITVSLPFPFRDVSTAINNLLQTTLNGDNVVILRRRITMVFAPPSPNPRPRPGYHRTYVRVGIGPATWTWCSDLNLV